MVRVLYFKGTARDVWKEWSEMVRAISNVTLKELKEVK